jgi:type I restriction enzyme S subunit
MDVSVIPKDWDAGNLGRFWGVTDCKHLTAQFVPRGYPLASITEVQSRFVDLTNAKQTTSYFYNLLVEGRRKPRGGDLILSRNATVGEVAQVADWHPPFAMGQDVCLLRKRSSEHSTEFLQAVFQSSVILNQLADLMVGSTFKRANIQQIRNFAVPMPPPREQRAIAEALSDVDGLLGGLDRLIAKKRDFKQAAMQQLLTGQIRLPGFHGDWQVKRLGNFLRVRHGKSQHGITAPDGKYPILASGGEIGRTNAYIYDKPSVLIGRKGTIDSPQYADSPFWTVDTLFFTEVSSEADAKFVFYKFTMIRWRSYNEASGVPSLNAKTIENIEVTVPPLPEQAAIASVLTEMDAELAALEKRQKKTRALKLGMMQELLTGRIRLIPPQMMETEKPAHNWQINEAVIIGALALQFGTEAWPLPRKRRVKLTYLLHRHAEGKAEGYLKKAAGPYNPKTKYQGPEGIALKNGYVREHHNGKYGGLVAGGKIAQAEQYFAEWYPGGKEWVEQFRFSKTDDLEVLATVDMAIEDLKSSNRTVSLKGVKEVIRAHPEWEAKLSRSAFSDVNMAEAMSKRNELFMSSTPDI